jgi:hypothetical protein
MTSDYTEPVSKLLSLGELDWDEWDDYSRFSYTKAHVPELIRLGTDRHLLIDDDIDDDEMWAPMHAWRVLAQMQAVESIAPLAQALDWSSESDSDLINEGLTDVLEEFGEPAVDPLTKFINDSGHNEFGYINASEVLANIAGRHPECRERVVASISAALEAHFERNDEDVNGFWLADLLNLKAVESYPIIKKVFEAKKINVRVAGDLEDVEIEFGMREKRDTPPPNVPLSPDLLRRLTTPPTRGMDELLEQRAKDELKRFQQKAKKEKNKRKQEKKSRKKNRKRK